jgi:hypothetical protein
LPLGSELGIEQLAAVEPCVRGEPSPVTKEIEKLIAVPGEEAPEYPRLQIENVLIVPVGGMPTAVIEQDRGEGPATFRTIQQGVKAVVPNLYQDRVRRFGNVVL